MSVTVRYGGCYVVRVGIPAHSLRYFVGCGLFPVPHDVFVAHGVCLEPWVIAGGRHGYSVLQVWSRLTGESSHKWDQPACGERAPAVRVYLSRASNSRRTSPTSNCHSSREISSRT